MTVAAYYRTIKQLKLKYAALVKSVCVCTWCGNDVDDELLNKLEDVGMYMYAVNCCGEAIVIPDGVSESEVAIGPIREGWVMQLISKL